MAEAPGRLTFADITAPMAPATFFAEHWTRRGVLLRQEDRRFDAYFDWTAMDAVLNAGDIAFPKIKLSRSERPVPTEQFTVNAGAQRLVDGRAVLDLFAAGASIGITGADSHWPPLREVVDCLYDTLLESVHTNVYCFPANTQGFQCHFDLHEVFVLQLEGEKHWRVYDPTTESPVSSWNAEDSPHQHTKPYIDVVLGPGDVLYVPRGHWHYAVARQSTSMHVTVGITCRKGTAFLDWLTGELLQEEAWRQNVPLLADATAGGVLKTSAQVRAWGERLRDSMVAKLGEPDLFDRFAKDTIDHIEPIHNATQPDRLLTIEGLRFERPPGRRHYFTEGADGLTVTAGGSEVAFEGVDPGLLRKVFDADAFTVPELLALKPGIGVADVTELLTELARAGLLIAKRPT